MTDEGWQRTEFGQVKDRQIRALMPNPENQPVDTAAFIR